MAVSATMTASQRRFVYGVNVAVAVVLMVLALAIAGWAAGRFGGTYDWTSARLNSLSPRTVQLVRGLDQNVTITSLYSLALREIRPHAEKHKQHVDDLLDLYETAGRDRIATFRIDPQEQPDRVNDLLRRLSEKPAYRDEAAPHAEAIGRFADINARVTELVQAELPLIEEFARADQRLNRLPELAIIARMLRQTIGDAQSTEREVQTLTMEAIPRYGRAVELVRTHLGTARSNLQTAQEWMTGNAQNLAWLAEDARSFFAESRSRFAPLMELLDAEIAETRDLGMVELEQLYESLKLGQTVLVETPERARVLTQEDVWPFRMDRNAPTPPDGDTREFAGEQAISSAILQLTQTEKTGVIFTRFGGQPLLEPDYSQFNPMAPPPQAPFSTLHGLLERENFEVTEWDVQSQPDPPMIENAARLVFVVFPPQEPQSPNPMQPPRTPPITEEQRQRIVSAVQDAGLALFVVSWRPPASPLMPITPPYAFGDYLRDSWGVDVKNSHLVIHFTPNPQREGVWIPRSRNATVISSGEGFRFTNHEIGRPLQALPVGLQAAVPLTLAAEMPAGVTATPIAEVPETEDVWAIENLNRTDEDFQRRQGTQRYDDDLRSPFALAVAAESEAGARLVVVASEQFAADAMLQSVQLVPIGGSLQIAQTYPGNADLFINALHWLTGDSARIAVGPQRGTVPRLDKLKEGPTATFLRVFLVGIWPGLALAAGACVWFIRRR